MRLSGKVALITGAARGIGEAIAAAFAQEGARVIVSDLDDAGAGRVAARIGRRHEKLDVRREDDWVRVMGSILVREGRLDCLVNNAGITGFDGSGRPHDPEHASLDNWRAVHATNLDGVFLGCKHAITAMRRTGAGSIINMSSRSGVVGISGAAAYASSKAGVRNHTKSVALYCAEQGLAIRCNSIHPAAIMTPMWEAVLPQDEGREEAIQSFIAEAPLKRFGTPAEVAAIAVMLASDECPYMTGAEIHIDGGILAGSAVNPRS
jgi:NAD(P)-dependent dehydrogenase (short-subunit alcohol dehydrogenase family)